jgi:hypothetical protein
MGQNPTLTGYDAILAVLTVHPELGECAWCRESGRHGSLRHEYADGCIYHACLSCGFILRSVVADELR